MKKYVVVLVRTDWLSLLQSWSGELPTLFCFAENVPVIGKGFAGAPFHVYWRALLHVCVQAHECMRVYVCVILSASFVQSLLRQV